MVTKAPEKPAKNGRPAKTPPAVRAPVPPPAATVLVITPKVPAELPVGRLKPCPSNPRMHFDEPGIKSLAESMKQVGVLERLVVRPVAPKGGPEPRHEAGEWVGVDYFEIVCGHRRHRAAKLAGLPTVPVDVGFFSDAAVAAIQLVEQEQRQDFRASEEAYAYQRLSRDHTAEQISAMTGNPVSVVRSKIKVANLPGELINAMDDGKLPRAVAELIARIPGAEARHRAGMCVLAGEHRWHAGDPVPKPKKEDVPLTYRETKELIGGCFQVQLKAAPFDRKALNLIPNTPSCEACPKRAGNDPEATADGVRADMCLDPCCFRQKVEAHNKALLSDAKEAGRKILTKAQSRELFNSWNNTLSYDAPYVPLDGVCNQDHPKYRTFRQLLKGHVADDKVTVAVDHDGEPHELAPKQLACEVLRTQHKIGAKPQGGDSKADARFRREQAERDKKAKAGRGAGLRANGVVAEKVREAMAAAEAGGPGGVRAVVKLVPLLQQVAVGLAQTVWTDACRHVAKRRGLDTGKHGEKEAVAEYAGELLTVPDLLSLVAELVAARLSGDWGSLYSSGRMSETEKAFWEAFGVDRKKLTDEAHTFYGTAKEKKGKGGTDARTPKAAADDPGRKLVTIPGFPTAVAGRLGSQGIHTLGDLLARVPGYQEVGKPVRPDKLGNLLSAAGLDPGQVLRARDAVTGLVGAAPEGPTGLAAVPKFPADVAAALKGGHDLATVEDLLPLVEKQKAKHPDTPVYAALKALGFEGPEMLAAADALVDFGVNDLVRKAVTP